MTILDCPQCREPVTLPPSASGEMLVRCPLCQAEYLLESVFGNLPPALIVLGTESPSTGWQPSSNASGFAAERDPSPLVVDDDELRMEPDEAAPAFQLDQAPAAPSPIRRSHRPHRQKSALREMLKIVAGGIVGLAIGQAILWWGLKRDPLKFAPKVVRYASWAVPDEFKGVAIAAVEPQVTESELQRGDFAFDHSEPPDVSNASPNHSPEQHSSESGRFDEQDVPQDEFAHDSADDDDDESLETISVPMIDAPELPEATMTSIAPTDELPLPKDEEPDRVGPVVVRNLPKLTATDLSDRIAAARLATGRWNEAKDVGTAEMKRRAAEFFRSLASLGEVLTVVDQADEQIREFRDQVHDLLLEIAKEDGHIAMLRRVAPSWIAAKGSHHGVIFIGKVESVEQIGRMFESKIESGPGKSITVVSAHDPRQSFQIGTRVVVLGLILDDPATTLMDYTGEAAQVVLDGYHAAIPE